MSISTGIVVAIALKQVDRTPDAKTGTERNNQNLQNINCGSEKFHIVILLNLKS